VKRGLDDVLEGYRDKTSGKLRLDTQGRAVVKTQDMLRRELFKLNPEYEAAVKQGGEPLRLEEAFRNGGSLLLNTKVPAQDYMARFSTLGEADKQAWRGGIANQIFNLAQNGRLKPGTLATPAVKAKLVGALGKDAADQLIQTVERRMKLTKTGARINPAFGSQTYELGGAEADGQGLADAGRLLAQMKTNPVGAIGELFARGGAYAGTAGETVGERNALGDALLSHTDEMARQLDEVLKRLKMPRYTGQAVTIPVGTNLITGSQSR
jgi:hypothetical protein